MEKVTVPDGWLFIFFIIVSFGHWGHYRMQESHPFQHRCGDWGSLFEVNDIGWLFLLPYHGQWVRRQLTAIKVIHLWDIPILVSDAFSDDKKVALFPSLINGPAGSAVSRQERSF